MAHLYNNNMRCTEERLRILEAVTDLCSGFIPADVISLIEKKGYRVCLPTVYNNLSLFCDAGILTHSITDDGKSCFELVGASGPRVKLVCTSCGKVKTIDVPEINSAVLTRRYRGFTAAGFMLRVEGLCTKCRNRLAAQAASSPSLPAIE